MNEISTPIAKKSVRRPGKLIIGITPIKSTSVNENEYDSYEFDNLLDDIVNDSSLFRDGKRKCAFTYHSISSKTELSPDLSNLKKRQKTCNGEENSLKMIEGKHLVNENQLKNIKPDASMFQDEVVKDSGGKKRSCNKYVCGEQISEDFIENSLLNNVNGMAGFDSQLPNQSIFEKLQDNLTPKSYIQAGSKEYGESNDSCHLNVSLKENAVVDNILKTMDFEYENDNDVPDVVKKEKNVTQFGFSQILIDSVTAWENNIITTSAEKSADSSEECKLADQIRKKLLQNIHNVKIMKSETTGWSQIDTISDVLEDSVIQHSQYHELGSFYGLPSKVQSLYEEHKGIKALYPWQKECLTLKAIKERKNLVYALPTSGGKTLVAEILIMRELLCYKRNVLFILPFVSIVQEKVHDLSIFALELGFLVEEYAAGKGVIPLRKRRKRRSVVIATIEKANAVLISLVETRQLEEFGLIVVDELHLISEGSGRGATLESLLTHILHLGENIQIIGMTATIGNLPEIAKFLQAETYTGTFRPVELQEFVKCGNKIFTVNCADEEILLPVRTVTSPATGPDPDGIGELVMEIVPKDSVLIFCPTKKNCENVSLLLAGIMPKDLKNYKEAEKVSFFKALQIETNGQICPVMKKTIPYGVVYHHSGLTPGERKLLEEAFRAGTLSVICCTSTLAAGVNLPAARVILRSPYVGQDFITLSKYKQMIGRAGRAGMGMRGESYLICQPMDSIKVKNLLQSKMDDTTSKMDEDNLKSLILSAVGLEVAKTRAELRDLVNHTLFSVQAEKLNVDIKKMIDGCISSLFKMGAIKVKATEPCDADDSISKLNLTVKRAEKKSLRITNKCQLSVSRLGRAAMKGCIGLERAHELYGDLVKAQASLVLLTELHLLFLVTPYEMMDQIKPNYSIYFNVYMQLSAKEVPAAKTVGVTEFVISRLATGMKPKNVSDTVLNRFYIALMLNEMLKQQNIWNVAKLFQIPAGTLQTLMTSTSAFANNILRFSEELSELWPFKSLLSEFAPRLAHCCSAELLPLMELPAVKRGRAKQLYDAGFKTLNIVANADVNEMIKAVDHLPKRVACQIVAAARLLLLEKAESLKEEANEVLLGLADKIVSEK